MNTAKKTWVSPKATLEEFTPNEYVSACVTGTIQCVYPGKSWAKGDNGVYDDYNHQDSGVYTDSESMKHGICGDNATISFNGNTGSGYEFVNGVAQIKRPISNISYDVSQGTGTFYNVTWTSVDNENHSGTYHHKGRLIVTNIDSTHPNHS